MIYSVHTRRKSNAYLYFTGQHYDKETDLYFYNARYYDPSLGRFISADTIVQASSNPQTFNRYAYTSNNPINRVDPSGHSWFKKAWNWFKGNTIVGGFFQAVDTGEWKAYGRQVAVLAISSFASVIVPGAGAALASNFFANVGLHIIRGAAIGALAGGVSSEIMGGSFSSGAQLGAIGGAATGAFTGVTSSQQYNNWVEGYGFQSNHGVIEKYYEDGRFQEAIDFSIHRYEINNARGALYDSSMPVDKAGVAHPTRGVRIGPEAFTEPVKGLGGFDASRLPATLFHEGIHMQQFKSGIPQTHFGASGYHPLSRVGFETEAYRETLNNVLNLELSDSVIQYNHNQIIRYNDIQSLYNFDYGFVESSF